MPESHEALEEAERLEAGRLFFARPWQFIAGAPKATDLPAGDEIEVAFAGRSNVGKSSLINALTGQKALARTSNTPGRTRELNLFSAQAGVAIVDMPGYGYARAPKSGGGGVDAHGVRLSARAAAAPPRLCAHRRPSRAEAQ